MRRAVPVLCALVVLCLVPGAAHAMTCLKPAESSFAGLDQAARAAVSAWAERQGLQVDVVCTARPDHVLALVSGPLPFRAGVYDVDIAAGRGERLHEGASTVVDVLVDRSGGGHALLRAGTDLRGIAKDWYLLVSGATSAVTVLAFAQQDADIGRCGRWEQLGFTIASELQLEFKDVNGDGLRDVVVLVEEEVCATGARRSSYKMFVSGPTSFVEVGGRR